MQYDMEEAVKKKKSTIYLSRMVLRLVLLLTFIGAGRLVCNHLVDVSYNNVSDEDLKHFMNGQMRALIANKESMTNKEFNDRVSYLLKNGKEIYKQEH